MRQWSLFKRIISITMGLVVLAASLSAFCSVNAASTEYVDLTGRGSSMYPTIADGDRVRVQLCVNGTLIDVGHIVAYSTIVTGLNPGHMWIAHRVIEKYERDDTWYFKTKGDNNPMPDPWEIPEYWLLGIVVNIDHTENSYQNTETQSETELSSTTPSKPSFIVEAQTLLLTTGTLGIAATIAVFSSLRRRRQKNILTKANIYSCYSCRQYQIQYTNQLESINGRIGIRKILDLSRGFCRYLNLVIEDLPRQNCEQYEPKTYTENNE